MSLCNRAEADTGEVGNIDYAPSGEGTLRFNELQRKLPKMTHATLSAQLKQLEAEGLVIRTEYPQIPPRVEYPLSEIGRASEPVLESIRVWGSEYIEYLHSR